VPTFALPPPGGSQSLVKVSHCHMHRQSAQGLVEYGLIIALVAVLAIAALIVFGPTVSSLLSNLGGSV
jgi:pilus assembly protein Flp/PilA